MNPEADNEEMSLEQLTLKIIELETESQEFVSSIHQLSQKFVKVQAKYAIDSAHITLKSLESLSESYNLVLKAQ